ncbi:hypothetical protein B0H16DRAFT_1463903 [Mycena metata]|uniref:Uncharacterized protein n=1 Tax=Mycena metata TaxID=1033252 RepID=A0AAD7IJI1_9AGAR|nr:hypothetical protein B0H16DRAFT_1463903 [Mycena metata]
MHAHRGTTLFPRLSLVLLLTQICILSSLLGSPVSAVPAPAPAPEYVVTIFGFPVTMGGKQPGFGGGADTNPFGNSNPFGNHGGGGAAQKTTTTKTKAAVTTPAAPPAAPTPPPASPTHTVTTTTTELKAAVTTTSSSSSAKKSSSSSSSSSSSAGHTPAGNLGGAGTNPSNAITDKGVSTHPTSVTSSGSSATNLPSTASASSKSSSGLLPKILVPLIVVLLLLIGALLWMRRRNAAKKQRRFTFTDKSASGFAEKSAGGMPEPGAGASISTWSRFDSSSPFASVASLVIPPPVPAKSKTPLTQTPTRHRFPSPSPSDAREVDITDFIGSAASLQTHGDARSMVPSAGHGPSLSVVGSLSMAGSTVGHGSASATQGHSPAISAVYPGAYPIPVAPRARTSVGHRSTNTGHRTDDGHSLYNAAEDYNGYYGPSESPPHDEPALAESRPASPASPSPFHANSNPSSHPGSPSPFSVSPFAHPNDSASISSEAGGLSPSLEAEMHEFGHALHSPVHTRTPSPVYGLGGPAYEVPPHRHPNPGQRSSALYDPRNERLLAYERDSVYQDRSDVYGGMA